MGDEFKEQLGEEFGCKAILAFLLFDFEIILIVFHLRMLNL